TLLDGFQDGADIKVAIQGAFDTDLDVVEIDKHRNYEAICSVQVGWSSGEKCADEGDSTLSRSLFPEEIVKSGAGVQSPSVCGSSGIIRFAFDGSASDKKVASVSDIFFRNSFGNRLRAFELCAR